MRAHAHGGRGPHVTFCFLEDGGAEFYPDGADREDLARRLAHVVEVLHANPAAIRFAAGACTADGQRCAPGVH